MALPNYSKLIAQLNQGILDCEKSIKTMEDASAADGVDRSGAIAGIKANAASLKKQVDNFTAKMQPPAPEPTPKPKEK